MKIALFTIIVLFILHLVGCQPEQHAVSISALIVMIGFLFIFGICWSAKKPDGLR